jgi:nucleoside-diphosphate-sugar epimerase
MGHDDAMNVSPVVVVTGANGFVGSHLCAALVDRGASVRAVVRRAGTAPSLTGVEERVGEFDDRNFAAQVTAGADAAVTTIHPMEGDRATQRRVGVEGTATFARAARDVGVGRLVHVSTAAVYDRSPGVGDVDEDSPLVGDDGNAYAVTKRDTDLALAGIDRITRVLVRPPAILGPGQTSTWNVLRPAAMRADEAERHSPPPEQTFAWVHVDDLTAFIADAAVGSVGSDDGACTPVNVCTASATIRDYVEAVTRALGIEPIWDDRPAWTGRILAERARSWSWQPTVDWDRAVAEIEAGLQR